MKHRVLGLALLVLPAACGGSKEEPPPKVAEVSIHDDPGGSSDSTSSSGSSDTSSASPSSDPAPAPASSDTSSSAADPSAGMASAAPTSPASSGGSDSAPPPVSHKKKPSKAGPLVTAKQCAELTDKYIEVVISGVGGPLQGYHGKELAQAREMVKAAAANDPNLAKMQKACRKEIHKDQYKCAMDSGTKEEWADCLR